MATLHTLSSPAQPEPAPANPQGVQVSVRQLGQSFGTRRVLDGIDLDIGAGEFVSIVGRSGCGKSTLLRLLAGLDRPSAGQILLDGQPLDARDPAAQGIRLMFQDARLLPWKTVAQNVALGLEGPDRVQRVQDALDAVGLLDRQGEWPARLSGGQKQRVALARALVHRPRLLLLDEPLGALDALTRIEMHELIERLWRTHGFTALLVTHDVSEAVALADRVLLIEDHHVSLDHPVWLERPRSRGLAEFAETEDFVLQRVLRRPPASAHAVAAVPSVSDRQRVG